MGSAAIAAGRKRGSASWHRRRRHAGSTMQAKVPCLRRTGEASHPQRHIRSEAGRCTARRAGLPAPPASRRAHGPPPCATSAEPVLLALAAWISGSAPGLRTLPEDLRRAGAT